MFDPAALRAFVVGGRTLGDLEGITKEQQYALAELGFSYLTSGRLEEAETVFDGLLALDPYDAYFHLALGSVAHQRGDLELAERRYTRTLEINPFSATAHAHRGEIRVRGGRLVEGADDLARAVRLDAEGREPATIRAKATLRLLRERLGSLDPSELEQAAEAERLAIQETEEVVEAAVAAARAAEAGEAAGAPGVAEGGVSGGGTPARRPDGGKARGS